LEVSDGCVSLTAIPAGEWEPARGFVVDERTGAVTELVPAVEGRMETWRECRMPVVVNGRALLETREALIIYRSRP
jgi:hypothetical protein